MTEIKLSNGMVALVDDEDVSLVACHNWSARIYSKSNTIYAISHTGSGKSRKSITMHRLIMGNPTGMQVDHRNRNGLDNARGNLRLSTRIQNGQNKRIERLESKTSRFHGACWVESEGKWTSQITVNRKKLHLGRWGSEEEAAMAYDSAAIFYFKDFARPNFPGASPKDVATIRREARGARRKHLKSPYRGVSREPSGTWRAEVKFNSKAIYLGAFESPELAAKAYDSAAKYLYGDRWPVNFSDSIARNPNEIRNENVATAREAA